MNIESIRQAAKEGASGGLGLKLNGSSGNSSKMLSEFTTLNMLRIHRDEYLAAGKYRYGESQHIKDTHEGNLHLRYTRYSEGASAFETFAQTEFDEFKKLKRRDLFGVGLRHSVSKSEKNALYLGAGAFYEHEDFKQDPTQNIADEQTFRANLYISFVRTFSESISANLIAYYQPSVEGFGDWRAQLDSGLQIKLARQLSLTLEYDLQHDSQPVAGVKETDTTYLVGLSYTY